LQTVKASLLRRALPGTAVVAFFLLAMFLAVNHVDRFRFPANESSAVGSLRSIYSANAGFAKAHPQGGYAKKLSDLSSRSESSVNAEPQQESMIDSTLATGTKYGYRFNYSPHTVGEGKTDAYELFADPIGHEKHHFFMNETGVIRASETGPATINSAPLQ